jgi:hypothetical protein
VIRVSDLEQEFRTLQRSVEELIALLDEEEERFWISYLQRGLNQVAENRLSGATFILGCYGGSDTFSDFSIGERWRENDPIRFRNLNARLGHLRTRAFEAANAITARRSW